MLQLDLCRILAVIQSPILRLKPLNPKPLNPKSLNPKPLNPKPLNWFTQLFTPGSLRSPSFGPGSFSSSFKLQDEKKMETTLEGVG